MPWLPRFGVSSPCPPISSPRVWRPRSRVNRDSSCAFLRLQTIGKSVSLAQSSTSSAFISRPPVAAKFFYTRIPMLPVRGKETDMLSSEQDRRLMRRFDMRLPAVVKIANSDLGDINTETQNVSARGVFFYLDRPLPEGSRVDVTLTFPPHVTLTDSVRVRFTARVLRVENPLPVSRVGIAALIEEYEFLRNTP